MVVAILSIMATLGAIGFRELILNNQREAAINFVRGVATLVRSEAIKRSRRVGICKHDSLNSTLAAPTCDGALTENDWDTSDWLLFLDVDRVANTPSALCPTTGTITTDCVFRTVDPSSWPGRLAYNSGGANNYVFYSTSTGEVGTYDAAGTFLDTSDVQFWFCDPRGEVTQDRSIAIGPGPAKVRVTPGSGSRAAVCTAP